MTRERNGKVYPVLIKQDGDMYLAYVADINSMTQGYDFFDAIEMARDMLGTHSLVAELPEPTDYASAIAAAKNNIDDDKFTISDGTLTYVDIDVTAYKKKLDTHAVRKNVSIPAWLNDKAEEAGINFSRVLQDALLEKLG